MNEGIEEYSVKKKKEHEMGLLTSTGCFQPRHGVRATHDGKTADFLICFECAPIHIFVGETDEIIYSTGSPQDTFDGVLTDAGVTIGPRLLKQKKE